MATPTFPASLPAPLISGYGYEDDAGNVSRSPKSFGYQTQKQIGNTPYTEFMIQYVFTQAQMAIFEDFYSDDLINGHKWFVMKLQVGFKYVNHYCRLTEKYSANLISNAVWQVGFKLEVDIKTLISEEDYFGLIAYDTVEDFNYAVDILWPYANGYESEYTTNTILTNFSEDQWG